MSWVSRIGDVPRAPCSLDDELPGGTVAMIFDVWTRYGRSIAETSVAPSPKLEPSKNSSGA